MLLEVTAELSDHAPQELDRYRRRVQPTSAMVGRDEGDPGAGEVWCVLDVLHGFAPTRPDHRGRIRPAVHYGTEDPYGRQVVSESETLWTYAS